MPHVRRASDGTVDSLHRFADAGAAEFLDDADPEVQAFVGNTGAAGDGAFARLDADFIRVLEDLIDVLVRAKVINVTDLPAQARSKLYSRKGQRRPGMLSELNLLGETGDFDDRAAATGFGGLR